MLLLVYLSLTHDKVCVYLRLVEGFKLIANIICTHFVVQAMGAPPPAWPAMEILSHGNCYFSPALGFIDHWVTLMTHLLLFLTGASLMTEE